MKAQYLFRDAGGFPIAVPYIDGRGEAVEPDGVSVFSLDQAAARFGLPADKLAGGWLKSWGESLPGPGVSNDVTDSPTALPKEPNALRDHVLRKLICGHLSDEHFAQFKIVCQERGLNPFWNQLHAETRVAGDGRLELVIITHIDGFRALATSTGLTNGRGSALWCGEDGKWVDVWVDGTKPPRACKFSVYRKGERRPYEAIAHWDMYAQYIQTSKGPVLAEFWQRGPAHMLAKVAEALALRMAFPERMAGVYIVDEFRGQLTARGGGGGHRRRERGDQVGPIHIGDGASLKQHLRAQAMDAVTLGLTLGDWGLKTDAARTKVIAQCRADFGRAFGEFQEDDFRGAVMAAVMADPAKFGATPPDMAA